MPLRKKLSRKFRQSPQETAPPAPPQRTGINTAVLPAVRPSSPLHHQITASPLLSSPIKSLFRTNQHQHQHREHRRSRSFSGLTGLTTSKSLNALNIQHLSPIGLVDDQEDNDQAHELGAVKQPWRSQDTWRKVYGHSHPHPHPSAYSSPSRTPPTASPGAVGGWRSGEGGGFFGKKEVGRPRRKSEAEVYAEEVSSVLHPRGEDGGWKENSEGIRYRLKTPTAGGPTDSSSLRTSPRRPERSVTDPIPRRIVSATSSTSTTSTGTTSVASTSSSSSSTTIYLPSKSTQRPSPTYPTNTVNLPRTALAPSPLPPLLPSSGLPTRSSSFAMRPTHGSSPDGMKPIPWGRRSPSERRSASPTLTPPRITVTSTSASPNSRGTRNDSESSDETHTRAPSRALPPPPADVPCSPDPDHFDETSPPVKEQLVTPVTPPRRRRENRVQPSPLISKGIGYSEPERGLGIYPSSKAKAMSGMGQGPLRKTSGDSLESRGSRGSNGSSGSKETVGSRERRGGWI